MEDINSLRAIHRDIMRRCYDPKSVIYKIYGAKGIIVCSEWHNRDTFKEWAYQNGFIPGMRLTRKDTSKGYEPENCYWSYEHRANEKNRKKKKKHDDIIELKKRFGIKYLRDSPLFSKYHTMRSRCENVNDPCYKNYGQRGISVCDEWRGIDGYKNFLKWAVGNGWEKGLTIERIDNDKGYSPQNCKWITSKEQARNKRTTKLYHYMGKDLLIREIAEIEGVDEEKLRYRIKKDMSIKNAVEDLKKQKRKLPE